MEAENQTGGKRRRGRRGRQLKAERKVSAVFESTKLEKQVTLELIDASQSAMIHSAVKKILWEVGVVIEHQPTCKQLLEVKDCWQDDQGYMRLPEDLIDQTISTIPGKIVLYDHDGNVKLPNLCELDAL